MKKIVFIALGAFVLIVAGVVVFGLSKIGPIVQSAVNTYGPGITKTDVSLGDVDVSLFSAQAKLENFHLGNPKGFKSPEAMKVGSILVDIAESSLTEETIVIDRIEVLNPQLTYERTLKSDNFQAILNNITRGAGKSGKKSGGESGNQQAGSKKIIIKDFQLKGGKINLAASMLGQEKSVTTTLPEIHLTNIGDKKGGLIPAEAFKVIFAELSKHINSPDVMNVLGEQLKELKLNPETLLKNAPKEIKDLKGVGDKLKNLLGN
ncbi:MAG: hypothetical protein PVJ84_17685 [Desulfobacteraceae bacterium]|jgi:uncharacterized protein involved in outer membrane biogenesis